MSDNTAFKDISKLEINPAQHKDMLEYLQKITSNQQQPLPRFWGAAIQELMNVIEDYVNALARAKTLNDDLEKKIASMSQLEKHNKLADAIKLLEEYGHAIKIISEERSGRQRPTI